MIYESGVLTATNTDVLSGGRLSAIPYNGQLTLRFLADLNNATNNWVITLQKPDGDVPIDAQRVPASNPALDGVLDESQLLQFTFNATQGGHFTVSATETGTAILTWAAILRP